MIFSAAGLARESVTENAVVLNDLGKYLTFSDSPTTSLGVDAISDAGYDSLQILESNGGAFY